MTRMTQGLAITAAMLLLASGGAVAGGIITVPEMDAGGAALAVGLTAGVVALIRERRNRS